MGGHVVEQILNKGMKVKALSRNPEKASLPAGVQVVAGDLDNPDTLQPHLGNIDSLFLITQSDQSDAKFLKNQKNVQMAKEANGKKL
ncbi:SDR family oxidoreductase [Paenibacillus ottowii]